MKVILTEEQVKKIICEEIAGNQAMVNPRMVYAGLMKALSMGNINMEDAVKYPDNFSGKLRDALRGLVNRFLNKDKQVTDTMKADVQKQAATGISEEGVKAICKFETGKDFGYKMTAKDLQGYNNGDANGKRTYGYGLLFHPNGKSYMQDVKAVWTQPELEKLFTQSVAKKAQRIANWASENNVILGQNQFDAMTSALFNFGNKFLNFNICKIIAQNPDDPQIPEIWTHLSDGQGKRYPGLLKRRAEEASWYQKDIPATNNG